jgi:hypothetical protein
MVKGHMLYIKIYDAGTRVVNTSTSIQGRGLHIPPAKCHRPLSHDRTRLSLTSTLSPYLNDCGPRVRVGGKAACPYRSPQRLRSKEKPTPQGSDSGNLLDHHPPHRQKDSRIVPNTVEDSNRPRQTDYLKSESTGHVNLFMDIEIISL